MVLILLTFVYGMQTIARFSSCLGDDGCPNGLFLLCNSDHLQQFIAIRELVHEYYSHTHHDTINL